VSVALLGLPTDRNSSYVRGPAKAPAAIRRELFSEAGNPYTETGTDLRALGVFEDAGDAALREDDDDVERITESVVSLLRAGRRVVSLGGDHSVTFPILKAYSAAFPNISIVHFDAHPDMYPSFQGNPLSHASPFARILEHGGIAKLVQIGIRTMTPPQRRVADQYGVDVFGAWELEAARAALPSGPVYVSLDLDGLDPAFAPGVSHREPGGLSVREVLDLVRAIPGSVVGADVVEYNPDCDVDRMTATVSAKFTREFAARIYADTAAESPA
jgi:agmatinase